MEHLAGVISSIILPLFGIMLAGYLAGRSGFLQVSASAVLGRFAFMISFPALAFVSLSRVTPADFFNWPFLGALVGGMLITFFASFVIARIVFPDELSSSGLHALTAMYASTGYIGLPLIVLTFGDTALVPAIIGAVVTGGIFTPMAILIAEISQSRKNGGGALWAPLRAVATNPVVFATAAGLVVSALALPVPAPFASFCEVLGEAFVPCSLFSAGLFMYGCRVEGDKKEVAWLVCVKLAMHPLITFVLARYVFALDDMLTAIVVLQAALPTGVPVFVLAQQYGIFVNRSNAVIVISTVLSLITLTALLIGFKV